MTAITTSACQSAWTFGAAAALLLVGLGALAPISVSFAPYSLVVVAPAFLISGIAGERFLPVGAAFGAFLAPIAYLALARHICRTEQVLPKFSIATFVLLSAFSLVLGVSEWENTVRYTSSLRATALVAQAILPPIAIAAIACAMRRSFSVGRSLWLHWLSLAWLAWSAFPWYGELL